MEAKTKKNRIFAKSESETEVLQRDLLNFMLKKAGVKYDDLITSSIKMWIGQNLDLLAEKDLEKYKKIILV
jgi:hypothetical protein